jgi:hypothetical protein
MNQVDFIESLLRTDFTLERPISVQIEAEQLISVDTGTRNSGSRLDNCHSGDWEKWSYFRVADQNEAAGAAVAAALAGE